MEYLPIFIIASSILSLGLLYLFLKAVNKMVFSKLDIDETERKKGPLHLLLSFVSNPVTIWPGELEYDFGIFAPEEGNHSNYEIKAAIYRHKTGYRILSIRYDTKLTLQRRYSQTGIKFHNFDELIKALEKALKKQPIQPGSELEPPKMNIIQRALFPPPQLYLGFLNEAPPYWYQLHDGVWFIDMASSSSSYKTFSVQLTSKDIQLLLKQINERKKTVN